MSVRRLADEQPTSFEFTPENKAWAEKEIAKYPPGRQASAVLALLWRAQKQNGYWLPQAGDREGRGDARHAQHPRARGRDLLYDVQSGAGRPPLRAALRHDAVHAGGAEDIKAVCRKRIGEQGHVTSDGLFSWIEVECLGACCNAPMVQINDDYYEDLTPENFAKLLDDLAAGRPVKTGSQIGRVSSEPVGGLTSLTTLYGVDGRGAPSAAAPANDQPPSSLDQAAAHAHAEAEAAHIQASACDPARGRDARAEGRRGRRSSPRHRSPATGPA